MAKLADRQTRLPTVTQTSNGYDGETCDSASGEVGSSTVSHTAGSVQTCGATQQFTYSLGMPPNINALYLTQELTIFHIYPLLHPNTTLLLTSLSLVSILSVYFYAVVSWHAQTDASDSLWEWSLLRIAALACPPKAAVAPVPFTGSKLTLTTLAPTAMLVSTSRQREKAGPRLSTNQDHP